MNRRQLLISLSAATAVALGVWFLPAPAEDQAASIVVPLAERVTWEGTIVGVMESGGALAVERSDGMGRFAVQLRVPAIEFPEGLIAVSGVHTGNTCAYRNTVFEGECVPELTDAEIDISH